MLAVGQCLHLPLRSVAFDYEERSSRYTVFKGFYYCMYIHSLPSVLYLFVGDQAPGGRWFNQGTWGGSGGGAVVGGATNVDRQPV